MTRGPEASSMVSPEGREKTKRESMRSGRLVFGFDAELLTCSYAAKCIR